MPAIRASDHRQACNGQKAWCLWKERINSHGFRSAFIIHKKCSRGKIDLFQI